MAATKGSTDTSSKPLSDSVVIDTSSSEEHHGIPKAIFFDDIEKTVDQHSAPLLIDKLSSLSQKYRFFEERLVKGKDNLEEKMADSKRAIAAVSAIQKRYKAHCPSSSSSSSSASLESNIMTKTHFELSDGIYVSANIPATDKVCLWLGANVMVEFSHDEALKLLNDNLATTQSNLKQTCDNIVFLRDQLNTTDVNLSRVYNHHVKSVRASSTAGSSQPSKSISNASGRPVQSVNS